MATTHRDMFIIGHCIIRAFVMEGCVGWTGGLFTFLETSVASLHTDTRTQCWICWSATVSCRAWWYGCFCSHGFKPLAKIHPWIAWVMSQQKIDRFCECLVSCVFHRLVSSRVLHLTRYFTETVPRKYRVEHSGKKTCCFFDHGNPPKKYTP